MPVIVEYRTHNEGWKAGENGRFGMVAVAVFKDAVTGARLFEWAPTLNDCDKASYFLALIRALDEHNKALLTIQEEFKKLNDKTLEVVCSGKTES